MKIKNSSLFATLTILVAFLCLADARLVYASHSSVEAKPAIQKEKSPSVEKESPVIQKEKTSGQIYEENNPAVGKLLITLEANLPTALMTLKKGQVVRVNDTRQNYLFDAYLADEPTKDGKVTLTSSGTGWFFDKNEPFLCTCYHVVSILVEKKISIISLPSFEVTELSVDAKMEYIDNNNYKHSITLLGVDKYTDVACVRVDIKREDYRAAKISNRKIKIGDRVCAIGAPKGLVQTLTEGIISYNGRPVGIVPVEYSIQTDCPLNPGNSGCPVFNNMGEVIGICNSGLDGSDGLSWLIPVDLMKLDEMKNGEDIVLPYLGFDTVLEPQPLCKPPLSYDATKDEMLKLKKILPGAKTADLFFLVKKITDINSQAIVIKVEDSLEEQLKILYVRELMKQGANPEDYKIIVGLLSELDIEDLTFENCVLLADIVGFSKSQIQVGDLILSLDGHPVKSRQDIMLYLHQNKKPGDKVKVLYARSESGSLYQDETVITLKEFPDPDKKDDSKNEEPEP